MKKFIKTIPGCLPLKIKFITEKTRLAWVTDDKEELLCEYLNTEQILSLLFIQLNKIRRLYK